MPTREQIIRQALTLARKRLANGGSLSDEEYLNRYGGGWEDLPGITQPFPEEERTTTPSPGLPTTTTPSTYSPPSYSAPSSRAPAPVQDFDEPSAPSAPSPSSAPSSFGSLSYSVTPGPQIDEGRVGPTDTFGSMVGLRAAANPTPTITEMTTDFTLSPTLGRPAAQEEQTATAAPSSPYGTLPSGFIGGIPSSQNLTDVDDTAATAPSQGVFGSLSAAPGQIGYSTTSQQYGPSAVEQYFTSEDLGGKISTRAEPIGPMNQPIDPDLPAPYASETIGEFPSEPEARESIDEGLYGGPSDANIGDDNGPAGYGGYGGYGGPSDAGIGDDNGPAGFGGYGGDDAGSYGGYGGDDAGSYGGGEGDGGDSGDGGDGGGDGGDGGDGGGSDGGGGDGGGGDGGGGDGGGEKRGGRILKNRPDVSKALRIAEKHARKDKSGSAIRLARGEVLSDRYPTQYLPEVGRQVMADGGVPQDDYRAERQLINYANELDRNQRRQDVKDALSQTWPAQLAKSVVSAATAPRDAYVRGMETGEMVARGQDLAGLVTGGGFGFSRPSSSLGMSGRFLPPAENSRLTQIATTGPSYAKALSNLERAGIEGRVIDYGAGRGHGLRHMAADTFEPYPQGWTPTFMRPEDIPDEAYRRLVNLNVLNVLSPEARESAVRNMGRIISPEGGGVISTRGRDVLTAKGTPGPEPMSLIIGQGDLARYQKGFTPRELREYVGDILGPRFDVMPSDVGQASVLFRRTKKKGGSVVNRALMLLSKKT